MAVKTKALANITDENRWAIKRGYLDSLNSEISSLGDDAMLKLKEVDPKAIQDKFLASVKCLPVTTSQSGAMEIAAESDMFDYNYEGARVGSDFIAIVPIMGVMIPKATWWTYWYGGAPMREIGMLLKELDLNPNVKAVVLHIDSPGGTVSGTENLGRIVAKMKKPIVAFGDNNVHSAAYWVASQADYIIANGKTTSMGSIGVMMTHYNAEGYYNEMGLQVTYLTAPQSTNKVVGPDNQQLSDEDRIALETILGKDAEIFLSTVKSGRGSVVNMNVVGDASVFISDDTLTYGLHDMFAKDGITDAVMKANELAKQSNSGTKKATSQQNSEQTMAKYKNLGIEAHDCTVANMLKTGMVMVEKSVLNNLEKNAEGLNLESLSSMEVEGHEKMMSFPNLGIEGKKAEITKVITAGQNYVFVSTKNLAALNEILGQTSEEDKGEAETDAKVETEETAEATATVDPVAETKEVKTEETADSVVEEEEEVTAEATNDNLKPVATTEQVATTETEEAKAEEKAVLDQLLAQMKSFNEQLQAVNGQNEELKQKLAKETSEKEAALATKEKVVANAKELEKKKGIKILTPEVVAENNMQANNGRAQSENQKIVSIVAQAKSILKNQGILPELEEKSV